MKEKRILHVFGGLVRNQKNQVLIAQRIEPALSTAHNKWDFPGGKITFGETPAQTVEREVKEETGYIVHATHMFPQPYVVLCEYPTFIQHTILICFACILLTDVQQPHSDPKIGDIRWASDEQIEQLDCLPGIFFFLNQEER